MHELWRALHASQRAVLEVVAYEYSTDESASAASHQEYLNDLLDKALEEYSKILFVQKEINLMKEKMEKIRREGCHPQSFVIDTKNEPGIIPVPYFDPRIPA